MKNKFLLIICISYLLSNPGFAFQKNKDDEDFSKNVIFFEGGGSGIGFSVNYERLFTKKIGLRLGAGSLFVNGFTIPIIANFYIGESKNKLELGSGIIYVNYLENDKFFSKGKSISFGMTVGLRHQKPGKGIVIRLSFTPLFKLKEGRIIPIAGFKSRLFFLNY